MLLKLTIFFPLIFAYSVTAQKLDDDITLEKKPLVILPAKNHYNKNIADKYQVDGYPTIKLLYKNKVYDFDAKVTKDNLVEFLDSIK